MQMNLQENLKNPIYVVHIELICSVSCRAAWPRTRRLFAESCCCPALLWSVLQESSLAFITFSAVKQLCWIRHYSCFPVVSASQHVQLLPAATFHFNASLFSTSVFFCPVSSREGCDFNLFCLRNDSSCSCENDSRVQISLLYKTENNFLSRTQQEWSLYYLWWT